MRTHRIFGHQGARTQAARALTAGRLPQVTMVTGPAGIGKQRFALWLGQLLLCQAPTEEPCGTCRSCTRVLGLTHPDLHWFIPIQRPKAGEADRQVEEASELIGETLAARRETPFYELADGMAFHPIASVRLLLRRAALTPVEGSRKVFVLGNADRLVPQESSPEAANALLKFLEEPSPDTWIILTTTEAERVLPTIRSRVVPIRLSRLPDSEVRAFITEELGAPVGGRTEDLVRQAGGSIGNLERDSSAKGDHGKARADARALLESLAGAATERFERALRQPPWAARGAFTGLLDALSAELVDRARRAGSAGEIRRLTGALQKVETAREEAQGNVNPQLILSDLTAELAGAL